MQSDHFQSYQVLNFLDIEVILYYKDTIAHDYLPNNKAHPKHCKDNLP